MASDSPPLSMTIPSDLRLLGLARNFVESACQYAGLDRPATDAIVLASHEAINNIIRHAHQGNPEAKLQIVCQLSPEGLEVILIDEGDPFDVTAVPHLNPAELRIGGRGVYLMRMLMDELTCQPRGERGNTLRMVKRCRVNSPASKDR